MRTRTIGVLTLVLTAVGSLPLRADDGFFFNLQSARHDPFETTIWSRDVDPLVDPDRFAAASTLGYSWNNGVRVEGDLSLRRGDRSRSPITGYMPGERPDKSSASFTITSFFDIDRALRLQSHIGGGIRARDDSLDTAFATVLAPDGSHEPYRLMFNAGLDYGVSNRTRVSLGYRYLRASEAGITSGSDTALDPTESQHMLRFRLRVGF